MLEPWRSQYLQALGVEIYLAKYPLPSAAPSCEIAWDATVPVSAPAEEPVCDEIALDAPIRQPHNARPMVDVAVEVGQRPARHLVEETPARTPVAPTLRIKLSIIVSDSGVLIIDDALSTARNDTQRLLTNLLFALQGRTVGLKMEPFEWPLPNLRNRQIDLNEQAARETLAGLLSRKMLGDVKTILLLGNNAQYWIDASLRQTLAADRALSWGLSSSAASVLNDPALKRQWWQDLRSAVSR